MTLALAACAPPPKVHKPKPSPTARQEQQAKSLAGQGQHASAAERYNVLAQKTTGSRRVDMHLNAAEQWLAAGRPRDAADTLDRLKGSTLQPAQRTRLDLARAQILILQGQGKQALQDLTMPPQSLPRAQAARLLALRGRALALSGDVVGAVQAYAQRDDYLSGKQARARNNEQIWSLLQQHARAVSRASIPPGASGTVRGWLRLAQISQSAWVQPQGFRQALANWQRRYPDHPANRQIVPRIRKTFAQRFTWPTPVGLLLPLSGRYARAAHAIEDGFMAAYYDARHGQGPRPELHVYDIGDYADDVVHAYQQARDDGMKFIVGPLSKSAVDDLLQNAQISMPVLALNEADKPDLSNPKVFQFGLSPEDEARQVAERAVLDGRYQAVSLVPQGRWGQRVAQAFASRFTQLGGTVLTTQTYDPSKHDYSGPIRHMLHLDQSRRRKDMLERAIGRRVEFEPRRRQDVDMIFLAAFPQQARLIRPQLRFFHASHLPVYATSHVFSGVVNPSADHDMDGIIFPGMPWTLKPGSYPVEQALGKHWGALFRHNKRLFALGYDAYRLIPLLRGTPPGFIGYFPGATGKLYVGKDQQIHRKLLWARFRDGKPVLQGKGSAAPSSP
ncbi:MAG TPA: penicillin-binding protein activator [Gammaproteobacteria bacterium]|nr:penicillin-binding protein activator [Gammaproteobacteria bacterium]